MLAGLLSFDCPACGVRLQVPPAMAGVAGPCPQCRTLIQAPAIVRQPALQRLPGPGPSRLPAPAPAPRSPGQPRQSPASIPLAPRSAPCPRPVAAAMAGTVAAVSPERPRVARREGSDRRRRPVLLGFVVPLLFVLTCGGLFLGTVYLLRRRPAAPPPAPAADSTPAHATASGLWPIEFDSNLPHDPGHGPPADAAPAPPAPSALGGDTRPTVDQAAPPAHWAGEVLEQFLAADSLAERLPLILTKRTPQDLAATSLAGPLPQPAIPGLERQTPLPDEFLIEFFFRVSFPDAPPPHPKTVALLVHQRDRNDPPKIVADPFVDLFDGGLADFGAAPLDGSRTFHAIVEPLPICNAAAVPEADKKITLRLRPHETARELANAYVNRRSSIGEMLDQPRPSLRWGQATPCVVTLRWNQDVPAQPFLELVRIDALTWNR